MREHARVSLTGQPAPRHSEGMQPTGEDGKSCKLEFPRLVWIFVARYFIHALDTPSLDGGTSDKYVRIRVQSEFY